MNDTRRDTVSEENRYLKGVGEPLLALNRLIVRPGDGRRA
ncbi:hypothetical protein SAMN02787118_12470 [Streptomyces mirabilis]|jgi:hypothetical protein|uniref:Uncharacterized protein n=1 Tax=Streptomyces mirabilis TaxID=68239 RepID=A0A1I2TCS9_9ACTN|nr:hypothetical protein SAMN02787118_12470 [Streptomyces mirabilis]